MTIWAIPGFLVGRSLKGERPPAEREGAVPVPGDATGDEGGETTTEQRPFPGGWPAEISTGSASATGVTTSWITVSSRRPAYGNANTEDEALWEVSSCYT